LLAELDQWNRCETKVYNYHASTMDAIGDQEANEFKVEYDDRFINELDSEQQKFVLEILKSTSENTSTCNIVSNLDAEVTQFRQVLHTADQFQIQVGQLTSKYTAELAYKLHDKARIIPIDADKRTLGLFEDTKEKRRENELRNAQDILRLISRQPSSVAVDKEVDEEENSSGSDMEVDE
jgi:hypothetical protein